MAKKLTATDNRHIVRNWNPHRIVLSCNYRAPVRFASGAVNERVCTIKVPNMGDSITEGTILEWKVDEGSHVELDQVICVIETDKISVEIHAGSGGVVRNIRSKLGDVVFVGKELVDIHVSGTEQCGGPDDESYNTSVSAVPQSPPGNEFVTPPIHKSPSMIEQSDKKLTSKFPRRPAIKFRYARPENDIGPRPEDIITASTLKVGERDKEGVVCLRLSDLSELPDKYWPSNLDPVEIESINAGLNVEVEANDVGFWATEVRHVKAVKPVQVS